MSEVTNDVCSRERTSNDCFMRLDSLAGVLTLPRSCPGKVVLESFPLFRPSLDSRHTVALDEANVGVPGVEDGSVQLEVAFVDDSISVSPEVLRQLSIRVEARAQQGLTSQARPKSSSQLCSTAWSP
jgi:hypothetical protein